MTEAKPHNSPFLSVQAALNQGTRILEDGGIGVPRLTAEVLLCHALRRDRSFLYAHGNDELSELAWIHYGRYLNERLQGKPTQYITHRQEFFGREFFVDTDVLIPRPETEHLVETTLAWLRQQPTDARILDVGTGSGAIAISLALESGRHILASDISMAALAIAEKNRATHDAPVSFFAADLLIAVRPASLDLVVSNPPYVPGDDEAGIQKEVRDWEPHVALFGGKTGLEIYGRLIDQAASALRPGGRLFMELGYRSLDGVRELLLPRFGQLAVTSDLAGWPRVIAATLTA